jgi:hypothetical protein
VATYRPGVDRCAIPFSLTCRYGRRCLGEYDSRCHRLMCMISLMASRGFAPCRSVSPQESCASNRDVKSGLKQGKLVRIQAVFISRTGIVRKYLQNVGRIALFVLAVYPCE